MEEAKKPRRQGAKDPRRAMYNEIAAIAYVQMENGEYKYGDREGGVRRIGEGRTKINKRELMRLAGYQEGSWDQFDRMLGKPDNQDFWDLVQLYRLRRTNPLFRSEQRNEMLNELVTKLSQRIYEQVEYYPHTIPFRDSVWALVEMVKMGARAKEDAALEESKSDKLLSSLPPEQRSRAIAGMRSALQSELVRLEQKEAAHRAADREQE